MTPKPINWNLLAKRAWQHGRNTVLKLKGKPGQHLTWKKLSVENQQGFIALVKFVAKELKKL